jgi:UDP-N-acetylmuramate--alanine ligase
VGLVTPVAPVPLADLGRVHFTGIGGAGMSGIARIMIARGVTVSGSDSAGSELLASLAALGADVHVGHAAANLADADTVVVSSAIRPDNPELAAARVRGLRVLHRAAALASLMLGRRGVAVAGTHGKTTTSSMITTALRHCGADPGYVVGGILSETGLGAEDGSGGVFVAEADESDGSFLMLSPEAAVVTCVEADHLDNYAGLAEIEGTFAAFARRIVPGGVLVACADDPGARSLAAGRRSAPDPGAHLRRGGRRRLPDHIGGPAWHEREPGGSRRAQVRAGPAGAGGAGTAGGGRPRPSQRAERGRRLRRRARARACRRCGPGRPPAGWPPTGVPGGGWSPRARQGGITVLDSYAHHPTELAADLRAARDIAPGGRVIAVFQPHLFSRTRIFASEFGAALGLADEVFVLDVYAAREDPEPGVTGELVARAVPGGRAVFLPDAAAVPGTWRTPPGRGT